MAKRINQLPKDINLTRNRLLFSGDPDTGKLYEVTYEEMRTLILLPEKFTINTNSTHLVLAGNMIAKVMITPQSNSTIKAGTTAGGEDVVIETAITGGSDFVTIVNLPARVNRVIYFSGIISNTAIAIYLEKI